MKAVFFRSCSARCMNSNAWQSTHGRPDTGAKVHHLTQVHRTTVLLFPPCVCGNILVSFRQWTTLYGDPNVILYDVSNQDSNVDTAIIHLCTAIFLYLIPTFNTTAESGYSGGVEYFSIATARPLVPSVIQIAPLYSEMKTTCLLQRGICSPSAIYGVYPLCTLSEMIGLHCNFPCCYSATLKYIFCRFNI